MVASVTLPSGRMVELREPTVVEEIEIVSAGADNLAEMMWAKLAVIAPSVTKEEAEGRRNLIHDGKPLSRADGRALVIAVGKIWDGRPEEQEAPFENGSATPSMDSETVSQPTS